MKAQRNTLQNKITKNKPRGKGKTKDKNVTSEHGDSALLQKLQVRVGEKEIQKGTRQERKSMKEQEGKKKTLKVLSSQI